MDMHARIVKAKHGPELLVRPLRDGDTASVQAVFERLGESSRRARFNGPKPRLAEHQLCRPAGVGPAHPPAVADGGGGPPPGANPPPLGPGAPAEGAVAGAAA